MINIKKILEDDGILIKFNGAAPEGFILVLEETLEDLKDYDIWVKWRNNQLSIKDLNKKNFNKN